MSMDRSLSSRTACVCLLYGQVLFCATEVRAQGVSLEVVPETPLLEVPDTGLRMSVDLLVGNETLDSLWITRLELRVLDTSGHLIQRRFLDERNGSGLRSLPDTRIEPGGTITLFNPFDLFEPWRDLDLVEFVVELRDVSGDRRHRATARASPVVYEPLVDLVLPVVDRSMVWDGHDLHSHHRRQDMAAVRARLPGIPDNPVRFAYDFSTVNEAGELHRGDPQAVEEWFAHGAPVRAPGAGVVVSSRNDVPDNRIEDGELIYPEAGFPDLMSEIAGNHVIIDHGDGEYSLLAHLLAGTVSVAVGDQVEQGQTLGRIGFSGDSGLHVHVHYQLMSDPEFGGGVSLPSYFRDFRRILGGKLREVDYGTVDTGEIVEPGG